MFSGISKKNKEPHINSGQDYAEPGYNWAGLTVEITLEEDTSP